MADLEAAIAAINDPARLKRAQELVLRAAPELQKVLGAAIAEGGWFGTAHGAAVREALDASDPVRAVHALVEEETRLGMLVGVAVGVELARELGFPPAQPIAHRPTLDEEEMN